jgi:hypothetical protein
MKEEIGMALTKKQIKEFKDDEKDAENWMELRDVANDIADAGDKKWAKKVYKKAEKKSENCYALNGLADSILKNLGDKEWVKKLYKKSEDKAEGNDDLRALAKGIYINLRDLKWSDNLYKKAPLTKEENKEFKEKVKEAEGSYDLRYVADHIADAGDKDWANKVYGKAEKKAEDYSDFRLIADSIHENLGDKEWAEKVYKKAEEKAENFKDLSNFADSIVEKLGDKDWVKKVYKKAEEKLNVHHYIDEDGYEVDSTAANATAVSTEHSCDFRNLADSICRKLSDKKWTIKLYKKAEEKAADIYDFESLAESIIKNIDDKEWTIKLYKKAEEKAADIDDFESLAESIRGKLGDEKWAKLLDQKALEKDQKKANKKDKKSSSNNPFGELVSNAMDSVMGDLENIISSTNAEISSAELEEQKESSHILIKVKNAHLCSIGYYKIDENNKWDQKLKEEFKEAINNNENFTSTDSFLGLYGGKIYDIGGMMFHNDYCSIDIYNEDDDLIQGDTECVWCPSFFQYGDMGIDRETNLFRVVNISQSDDVSMYLDIPLNTNFNSDNLVKIGTSIEGNIEEWNGSDGFIGFAYMNEGYTWNDERDEIEVIASFNKQNKDFSKLLKLEEKYAEDLSKAKGLSFSDIQFSFDTPELYGGGREIYANIDGIEKYDSSKNMF